MASSSALDGQKHFKIGIEHISGSRKRVGWALIFLASLILVAVFFIQILYKTDAISVGFDTWRAVLYAYILWAIALAIGQVLIRGELGRRSLFLLPAHSGPDLDCGDCSAELRKPALPADIIDAADAIAGIRQRIGRDGPDVRT